MFEPNKLFSSLVFYPPRFSTFPPHVIHRDRAVICCYKEHTLLHLFPSGLALNNLHHRQRVHKLHREQELGSAGSVLGKLEDKHDLYGNIRLAVVEGAVGGGLGEGAPSEIFLIQN